jgi:hypothetical protein
MLARRRTPILLAMTLPEALDTTRIHRVAGLTGDRTAWVTTRPFLTFHRPISAVHSTGSPFDGGLGLGSGNAATVHAFRAVPEQMYGSHLSFTRRAGAFHADVPYIRVKTAIVPH